MPDTILDLLRDSSNALGPSAHAVNEFVKEWWGLLAGLVVIAKLEISMARATSAAVSRNRIARRRVQQPKRSSLSSSDRQPDGSRVSADLGRTALRQFRPEPLARPGCVDHVF